MHASALFDIAIVVTAALVAGLALQRLRQPAIVGYILAGTVARHSLKLGEDGKHLFHRLRGPGHERPDGTADEADEAPFDNESEAAAAKETPKRIGPRARR